MAIADESKTSWDIPPLCMKDNAVIMVIAEML